MDPYNSPIITPVVDVAPVSDVVDVDHTGGGWHRVWVVVLIILKFGIPVIGIGLGIYILYRWATKSKRGQRTQDTRVGQLAEALKAMSPEERQAYVESLLAGK